MHERGGGIGFSWLCGVVLNQHIEQAALLAYTSQFAVFFKDVTRGILCIES
jgi:hypothetical protein